MKAIQEFAKATAVHVGGVGYWSQSECVLEYTKKEGGKRENNCSSVNKHRQWKKIQLKIQNSWKNVKVSSNWVHFREIQNSKTKQAE